jgi:glutamyl-tRNA reductase
MKRVAESVERCTEAEVAKARTRLASGGDPHEVLEAFAHGLTNKLLHPAMQALKDVREDERPALAASIVVLYFGSDFP